MKKIIIAFLKKVLAVCARLTIARFKPTIIAVTGSVGKTSAKEAIRVVLESSYRVRATSANLNNELGVPLTILGNWHKVKKPAFFFWLRVIIGSFARLIFKKKSSYPEYLVLEYGADAPGDISRLCSIAKPHIGVITAIGSIPVHVEFYQDSQSVMKEKATLLWQLPTSGQAIINSDDVWANEIVEKTKARVTTFGINPEATIKIVHCAHTRDGQEKITGITGKIEWDGVSIPVSVAGAFSLSHIYAVACSCAVGKICSVNMVEAVQAIRERYVPISGRSLLVDGVEKTQIIDESYNSSPLALAMALKSMELITDRPKVAILGDMMELGGQSEKAHKTIGERVAFSVNKLITVGPQAKIIALTARKNGMDEQNIHSYETVTQVIEDIKKLINENDIVLIKGSRVIGLEKIVEILKNK